MRWATLLNQYISETWERPSGCVARNVDGNPLVHGVDENVLPLDPQCALSRSPDDGRAVWPDERRHRTSARPWTATMALAMAALRA